MKKSEEIKKAVKLCVENKECAGNDCPYFEVTKCGEALFKDILPFIEQLEETISLMKVQMHGDCGVCKHRTGFDVEGAIMSQKCYQCLKKESRPNWEYEGLPELARKENK